MPYRYCHIRPQHSSTRHTRPSQNCLAMTFQIATYPAHPSRHCLAIPRPSAPRQTSPDLVLSASSIEPCHVTSGRAYPRHFGLVEPNAAKPNPPMPLRPRLSPPLAAVPCPTVPRRATTFKLDNSTQSRHRVRELLEPLYDVVDARIHSESDGEIACTLQHCERPSELGDERISSELGLRAKLRQRHVAALV